MYSHMQKWGADCLAVAMVSAVLAYMAAISVSDWIPFWFLGATALALIGAIVAHQLDMRALHRELERERLRRG